MDFKHRQVPGGAILVYSIGRTSLIENYLTEMERGDMRIVNNEMSRRAYQQLAELEVVDKDTGRFYNCLSGRHDDLGTAPCWRGRRGIRICQVGLGSMIL